MYTKAKIRGKILQEYFKDNLSFKIMKKKGELKKKKSSHLTEDRYNHSL